MTCGEVPTRRKFNIFYIFSEMCSVNLTYLFAYFCITFKDSEIKPVPHIAHRKTLAMKLSTAHRPLFCV